MKFFKFAMVVLSAFYGAIGHAQLPTYLPTSGLVAWYPFNGNANDESGNGNNGVVNGGTIFADRFGNPNASFLFDGIDDNIIVQNSSSLETSHWSINAWFKTSSLEFNRITSKDDPSNPYNDLSLIVLNGKLFISTSISGQTNSTLPICQNFVADNSWHHVIASRANGTYLIYLDGEICSSVSDYFPEFSTPNPLYIGSPSPYPSQHFNGQLDDIAIYNRALSASEVTALYTSTATNTGGGTTSTTPPGIPYQAEVRNENGEVLSNANVNVRFTLHELTANGTVSYQETHAVNTNELGLFAATIGAGTATQGTFAGINWAQTTKFLQVEVDTGNGYIIMGNQQLMSVPYALYAANGPAGPQGPQGEPGPAGPEGPAGMGISAGNVNNQIQFWNGTSWTTLNPGSNGQTLTICEGELIWTYRGICPGTITSFNCNSSTNLGTLRAETQSIGVSSSVPYTGGNEGSYPTLMIPSTGVQGLTATLDAGILESGDGSLVFIISGTPASEGLATFTFTFNNQQCSFTRDVIASRESCEVIDIFNSTASYGSLTDQDGYKYKTIIIGEQEWMAENLNTGIYRNGDSIITSLSQYSWQYNTEGSWEYYEGASSFACPYGKLYNWYACTDNRGLCPVGWRLPSSSDMNSLIQFLDSSPMDMSYNQGYEGLFSSQTAGGKLKSLGETYWQSPNLTDFESTGFSALPAGARGPNGTVENSFGLGSLAYFWSSSLVLNDPLSYVLSNNTTMIGLDRNPGYFMFSVRCIKE